MLELSLVSLVILIILVAFFHKIISVALKIFLYALLIVLVLVFIFGISYDQVFEWGRNILLLAF